MARSFKVSWWSLVCLAIALGNTCLSVPLFAQSGLREALEKLDTNQDGSIEPDEITPLARPYLERITRARRMSIDRPNEIDKLQEAARSFSAQRNGVSGRDVRPEGESSVKPFGPDPDRPLVPEFGLAVVKYPYTQDDLDFADRTIKRYDRNGDGYIDRMEAEGKKWTHRNPFDDDLDKDNRLSRLEMGQRYARRRLLEGVSDELVKKAWRTGSGVRPSTPDDSNRDGSQWRKGGSDTWLTASIMGRFDANRNGRLESEEAQSLGISVSRVDIDRDGELSREELHGFLKELQDEARDQSESLPSWFYELDIDRDGQVEMSEFATAWTDEKLLEFESMDTNGDALLTAAEVAQSKAVVGGSFRNQSADVLPPRKTIISEIEVNEDYVIGDLNVELSITHSHDSYLDAYLTGPDGQRIELFTEVGGSGDNFDQTLFDDQSRFPITKARSPFRGTFTPEGLLKEQPSLSHFNGKSVKGVWQLVVRGTRNDRFGMLHGWGLIVKPQDGPLSATVASPAQDGPRPTGVPPSIERRSTGSATLSIRSRQPGAEALLFKSDSKGGEVDWTTDLKSVIERAKAGDEQAISRYKLWLKSRKPGKDNEKPGKGYEKPGRGYEKPSRGYEKPSRGDESRRD